MAYTWEAIAAIAKATPQQPKQRSYEALLDFQDRAETPAGVPNGIIFDIPLESSVVMIRQFTRGSGVLHTFYDELVPWSWRQMLLSLGEDRGCKIVGSGVSSHLAVRAARLLRPRPCQGHPATGRSH